MVELRVMCRCNHYPVDVKYRNMLALIKLSVEQLTILINLENISQTQSRYRVVSCRESRAGGNASCYAERPGVTEACPRPPLQGFSLFRIPSVRRVEQILILFAEILRSTIDSTVGTIIGRVANELEMFAYHFLFL